jgi:hypothetical protein
MKILNKIIANNEEKTKTIEKILNLKKKFTVGFYTSGKSKLLHVSTDNKMIIGSEYNFYGIYQPATKLWIWASSIPGVDPAHIKHIRKIKSFDHLFESSTDAKSNFYYQFLTQDVLLINSEQILTWINELLLYLSNDLYYLNPLNSDNNIQFLTISKIIERYI